MEDAGRLLAAGADKVAVNSAAVVRPELISELAARFGRQCVVVSVDAIRREPFGWETVISAGSRRTGLSAVDWSTRAVSLGAGEILLTSHDRDGTGAGYDLDLVRAVSDSVPVPVIASGGAETPWTSGRGGRGLRCSGSGVLHDRLTTIHDIRRDLSDRGRGLTMLIPSIDIQNGRAVQPVERDLLIHGGDPGSSRSIRPIGGGRGDRSRRRHGDGEQPRHRSTHGPGSMPGRRWNP